MGGAGSGRRSHYGSSRLIVERVPALDVVLLRRRRLLEPGATGSLRWDYNGRPLGVVVAVKVLVAEEVLEVAAQWSDESEPIPEAVWIEWQPCRFGGRRPWFRCRCNRRVAKLYVGARQFRCRRCFGLKYRSQSQEPDVRALERARKLRARLGVGPSLIEGVFWKPKWMRWRTFYRLDAERRAAEAVHLAAVVERFGLVG